MRSVEVSRADRLGAGYIVLAVDELPEGFSASMYEEAQVSMSLTSLECQDLSKLVNLVTRPRPTAQALAAEPRDVLWGSLTPGVNHLLATPTCRGAVSRC